MRLWRCESAVRYQRRKIRTWFEYQNGCSRLDLSIGIGFSSKAGNRFLVAGLVLKTPGTHLETRVNTVTGVTGVTGATTATTVK